MLHPKRTKRGGKSGLFLQTLISSYAFWFITPMSAGIYYINNNFKGMVIKMNTWLTSLITNTPQEGFELAIKLAQMGVKYTQPSEKIRNRLRPQYSTDADSLIFASHVVALNYQTVAAANNYWK